MSVEIGHQPNGVGQVGTHVEGAPPLVIDEHERQVLRVDAGGQGRDQRPQQLRLPGTRCAGKQRMWPIGHEVDNQRPPGGEPRTPGYWANWSSCSNGNQWEKATAGDPDNEFTALDELLQTNVYDLGDLILGTLGGDPTLASPDCEDARNILQHREITGRNKVRANDAAYKLARSLLAYELNQDAGACQSTEADDAAVLGHALLDDIGFDGSGRYLRPKDGQQYQDALALHGILDAYNNGLFCP